MVSRSASTSSGSTRSSSSSSSSARDGTPGGLLFLLFLVLDHVVGLEGGVVVEVGIELAFLVELVLEGLLGQILGLLFDVVGEVVRCSGDLFVVCHGLPRVLGVVGAGRECTRGQAERRRRPCDSGHGGPG